MKPQEEQRFREDYAAWAAKAGMDPNPDDPRHFYDYRAAWKAGVLVEGEHLPSTYKKPGHPRYYIDPNSDAASPIPVPGYLNTKTGELVAKQRLNDIAADLTPRGNLPGVGNRRRYGAPLANKRSR